MIPVYLMVKQLGMLDTYWALIIPGAVSAFNIVIVRGFIQAIPQELFDAARMDGAGEWRIFASIVLPLSKAVIAVVGLFIAVGYWNNYFDPLLYLNDSNKWPLQLVMRNFVLASSVATTSQNTAVQDLPPAQSMQMALVVVATLPILCAYPFLSKHMSKGMLTGAIKG
jgi:ABC-type glycerol-3-phosphate transport system permease component